MVDLVVVPARVHVVESPRNLRTIPAGAVITAGMAVRMNTSARAVPADGSAAGTADVIGIAVTSAPVIGLGVTVAGPDAIVDLGDALDALAYGAEVYASDTGTNTGALGDVAGTSATVVGTVIPGYAAVTADKLLRVNGALQG